MNGINGSQNILKPAQNAEAHIGTNRDETMKTKKRKFKPDRIYIQDAVKRYLQQGGKIEKVEDISGSYKFLENSLEPSWVVDAYLMGDL